MDDTVRADLERMRDQPARTWKHPRYPLSEHQPFGGEVTLYDATSNGIPRMKSTSSWSQLG